MADFLESEHADELVFEEPDTEEWSRLDAEIRRLAVLVPRCTELVNEFYELLAGTSRAHAG